MPPPRATRCASTRQARLIGVTILNARWLLEHEGKITITIPERLEVEAAALGEALTAESGYAAVSTITLSA